MVITSYLLFILIFCSFQLEFSQAQLDLLRNIYSEIITSNAGQVSSTWCLNLCSTLNHRLTKAEAEEFLQLLVDRKWLFYKVPFVM